MKEQKVMSTKALTCCALFTALSVVLARLVGFMPSEFARFSIEAIPIFLAGLFFGPVWGACVGFAADYVGCLFSAFGYNPILCIPPILYGLCAGLMRPLFRKKVSLWKLIVAFAPSVVLGSILYQSWALGFVSGNGFLFYLASRAIQFAITWAVDVALIYLMFKTKLFDRIGLWNPGKDDKK